MSAEVAGPQVNGPVNSDVQPRLDKPSPEDAASYRRLGRLVGLGAGIVLAAGLTYGAWGAFQSYQDVMQTAERHRNFVPTLRVADVKASDDIIRITLPATTQAYTAANMFARSSGYISKRNVDIGDRVKKGDVLAEIYAPEIEYQLAQAEATLLQNQATVRQMMANMELARVTDERNDPLVERGFVSALNGDTYRLNLKAQEAQVGMAEANVAAQAAQVEVSRQQKKYQRIVAPFDGVVTQRNINIGDLMQADATSGTFMFTLMQSDVIRTQVYVPQEQATGLAAGVKGVVRVPQMPDRTFTGTVTRVADALAPGTRTLLTEIDIPNPEGTLTPGTYVTVELFVPRKTESLLVPAQAIIFNEHGMQVAVAKDGIANIQKVNVTRDLGTAIEVNQGVAVGDQVILDPPVDLQDGAKVKVRPQVKEASAG